MCVRLHGTPHEGIGVEDPPGARARPSGGKGLGDLPGGPAKTSGARHQRQGFQGRPSLSSLLSPRDHRLEDEARSREGESCPPRFEAAAGKEEKIEGCLFVVAGNKYRKRLQP